METGKREAVTDPGVGSNAQRPRLVSEIMNWGVVGLVLLGVGAVGVYLIEAAGRQSAMMVCQANLVRIDHAKSYDSLWTGRSSSYVASWSDLTDLSWLKGNELSCVPQCPGGGMYSVNAVDEFPSCSIRDPRFDHTYPRHVFRRSGGWVLELLPGKSEWVLFALLVGLGIVVRYQACPSLFPLFGMPRWMRDCGLRDKLTMLPSPHLVLLRYMDDADQRLPHRFLRAVVPALFWGIAVLVFGRALWPWLRGGCDWAILAGVPVGCAALLDLARRKLRGIFDVCRLHLLSLHMKTGPRDSVSSGVKGMRSEMPRGMGLLGISLFALGAFLGVTFLFVVYPKLTLACFYRLLDASCRNPPIVLTAKILFGAHVFFAGWILRLALLLPPLLWLIPTSVLRRWIGTWREALGRKIDRHVLDARAPGHSAGGPGTG